MGKLGSTVGYLHKSNIPLPLTRRYFIIILMIDLRSTNTGGGNHLCHAQRSGFPWLKNPALSYKGNVGSMSRKPSINKYWRGFIPNPVIKTKLCYHSVETLHARSLQGFRSLLKTVFLPDQVFLTKNQKYTLKYSHCY